MGDLVLFLDSNRELTKTIVEFLSLRKFEAFETDDPDFALKIIGAKKPRLVFFNYLETLMPPEDFIGRARELSPHSEYILFTGCAQKQVEGFLSSMRVGRVLYKPCSLETVLGVVQEFVVQDEKSA